MINNLKIGVKLYLAFGIISFILLIVGVREYQVLQNQGTERRDMQRANNLADAVMKAKFELKTDLQLVMEMLNSNNLSKLKSYFAEHQELTAKFDAVLETVIRISSDASWGPEYKSGKNEILSTAEELDQTYNNKILPNFNRLNSLLEQDIRNQNDTNRVEIDRLDVEVDELVEKSLTTMDEAGLKIIAIVEQTEIKSARASSRAKTETMILVSLALLFAFIISFVITRGITKPVQKGLEFAQSIASGDLTHVLEIKQNDEIGQLSKALNDMSERLKAILSDIQSGADQISNASQDLSSTSQEMSQGSSEQASSAEEVSSSMEEMASNIQQNTDNAHQTEKISIKASNDIGEGKDSVVQTVGSMKNIADKIGIISEIARQTNILALNAAVEAARAGEHGKGFAVVAEEVRKLAARSQDAAKEIDETSKSSVIIADKSGKLLEEIVPDIERTAKLVQEIAAASSEQSSGADQVNSAIQQLNQVTQQNAAASEEMATSSEELASQANQLKEAIGFFKIK